MNTNKFNNLNTAEVKEVVDFAERVRYMPDVKINQLNCYAKIRYTHFNEKEKYNL